VRTRRRRLPRGCPEWAVTSNGTIAYIRPLTGHGEEIQVSQDGGTEPMWARDGKELFYVGTSRAGSRLISASVRAGTTFEVLGQRPLTLCFQIRIASRLSAAHSRAHSPSRARSLWLWDLGKELRRARRPGIPDNGKHLA
jgi:hypothetical protein